MIIGALPFSMVMLLMALSLAKALWTESLETVVIEKEISDGTPG